MALLAPDNASAIPMSTALLSVKFNVSRKYARNNNNSDITNLLDIAIECLLLFQFSIIALQLFLACQSTVALRLIVHFVSSQYLFFVFCIEVDYRVYISYKNASSNGDCCIAIEFG